ncbi:MAG: DUF1768 domain-containing protein [Thermoplasmata archaeon]|nr:MAG: DUF1768 domain-containing protein [Thermoplasmata archaeon]
MTSDIIINEFKGPYDFLSNFHAYPVTIADTIYFTNEHFFQAFKTTTVEDFNWILNAATPGIAKIMGSPRGYKGRKIILRDDWDAIKDEIMVIGIGWKFSIPLLRANLIATGGATLIEGNYWHDNYWGNCYCPKCQHIPGQNKLGQIIMGVRDTLG